MAQLLKREPKTAGEPDLLARFDRFFDQWRHMFPLPRHVSVTRWEVVPEDAIRVDEYHENGTLVVKAELPGIDPETDVEVSVTDHRLRIAAERREDEELEDKGYVHNELRTGSFERTLTLPPGVTETDITASYKDGILEVRIPAPKTPLKRTIPVTRS